MATHRAGKSTGMVLMETRKKLGELLMERGLLDMADLTDALAEQRRSEELLGQILLKMGLIRDEELMFALADQRKMQSTDDAGYSTHRFTLHDAPVRLLIEYQALAPNNGGESYGLKLMATMESNKLTTPELEPLLIPGGDGATLYTLNDMLFHTQGFVHQPDSGPIDHGNEYFRVLLSRLLFLTLHRDAVSLQMLPDESGWKLEIMNEQKAMDIAFIHSDRHYLQAGLLAGIKTWAGLDPGEAARPQSGRMGVEYMGQTYVFDVATRISARGESVELNRQPSPAEQE